MVGPELGTQCGDGFLQPRCLLVRTVSSCSLRFETKVHNKLFDLINNLRIGLIKYVVSSYTMLGLDDTSLNQYG